MIPNFTAVPQSPDFSPTFAGVLNLLRRLRAPDGCPWDREQTPRSLIPLLLEEAHETAEAIEAGEAAAISDELGDLMLHLGFQIVIAEEKGDFTLSDVAGGLIAKMVRRHPHVFADADYAGDGHQAMWERLKRKERGVAEGPLGGAGPHAAKGSSGVIGELPPGLPALVRAYRIQQKVSTVGFDWQAPDGARAKVEEELEETEAAEAGPPERLEEEFGDLLFALVNWGRLLGVHPHNALQRANRKFEERFRRLESLAAQRGLTLDGQPLETLDALWDEVKELERA